MSFLWIALSASSDFYFRQYSLLAEASATGSPVMRALFWEFPDHRHLAGVDQQFLLGPAILVTPVLQPGADSVEGDDSRFQGRPVSLLIHSRAGFFPGKNEIWRDWYTRKEQTVNNDQSTVKLSAPLGHINLHVR